MPDAGGRMDRATVDYVARLSRIELSEAEKDLFAGQLSKILDYIAQLNQLDTSNTAPLTQAVEIPNVLREDAPRASLSPGDAVGNAPERAGDFYKVPAVLE